MSHEVDLCFRLLSYVDAVRSALSKVASERDLLSTDLFVLRALARRSAPARPSELAIEMRYSRPRMTELTRRLVAAGYVMEHWHELYAHHKTLFLTSDGQAALEDAMAAFGGLHVFHPLTGRERALLAQLVDKLTRDDSGPESHSSAEVVRTPNHIRERR